ncbi:MAG: solute carrier family 13 (sodium-dependent dicarboxylate transporter), er 2/3/5 [Bacteroidales bacterium]|nr:solute carrier family 13 (sodium-dependent dicarboxylate transporter), er 2/3/5 [Bacteroidales bacterium]
MTDPLDMHQYRIEKLPKRTKGGFEKLLASAGPWLALAAFILLGFFIHPSFLQSINPDQLSSEAKKVFEKMGETQFIQNNTWMLTIFAASLILWMTEAIPNYLTSLILIISLVLTGVLTEKEAFAQLGHPVMWLNIMSFILSSMLVATGLAKRFALVSYSFWEKRSNHIPQFFGHQPCAFGVYFGHHSKGSHFTAHFHGSSGYLWSQGQRPTQQFRTQHSLAKPVVYQFGGKRIHDRLRSQSFGYNLNCRSHKHTGVF